MKNLNLSTHQWFTLESIVDEESVLCYDSVCNCFYIVGCKDLRRIKWDGNSFKEETLFQWDSHSITFSRVISANYVAILNSVCIVTEKDIVIYNIDDELVDIAGSVDSGIVAAKWSPELENLIIVSETLSVMIMSYQFEPLDEIYLLEKDENQFVNVGWGKKETQFHGTEGKEAAKRGKQLATKAFDWDDKLPRITWRGDGQMFAVSFIDEATKARIFRVIGRDAIVLNTSEEVEGLEFAFDWKPSGNLIATTRRLSNKHNVSFFEKNGLLHNEFTLSFEPLEVVVKRLLWNADSSVLLVWAENFDSKNSILQLWTTGNYHWYIKQTIKFQELIDVYWDNENPFALSCLTHSSFHLFNFKTSVNKSVGKKESDLALVSSINGRKLLVTPFRYAVVPPPLSAYEIEFPDEIQDVFYAPSYEKVDSSVGNLSLEDSGFLDFSDLPATNSNTIGVFHGENTITILTIVNRNEQLSDFNCVVKLNHVNFNVHKVFSQHRLQISEDYLTKCIPRMFYNWMWLSNKKLIASYEIDSHPTLGIFELKAVGIENGEILLRDKILLEEHLKTITVSSNGAIVCLQLISGSLLKFSPQTDQIEPWLIDEISQVFPTPCEEVILCPVGLDFFPIGLCSKNKLFMGGTQILHGVTSIHLHNEHLLLTTTSHNLLVVPLTKEILGTLSLSLEEGSIGIRKVERGSRIITAVPNDTRVLLQMPRGNLEMISPRSLVVHKLKYLLTEFSYRQAMEIMRKQRLNLNLLFDHNPTEFLNNINLFVDNVNEPYWMDLFIASLVESDVTVTMYACNYVEENKAKNKHNILNKIDTVCAALRGAMVAYDEEAFLLPILTSLIKHSQSQIDVALQKLYAMKISGKEHKVTYSEGLHHLLLIADVNKLCNIALGTYNFDLVMMVYEKSQKDPKEYLPFLNNLKRLEETYRKFKIDIHLKKYESALRNAVHCDKAWMPEVLQFICKENLHSIAIEIFSPDFELYKQICSSYGDILLDKGHYSSAAVMFIRALRLKDSLDAYVSAGDWKGALYTSSLLSLSTEDLKKLCTTLVKRLREMKLYSEAALVYENYLDDEEEAVVCFLCGYNWSEAIRIACKYRRHDLIDDNVKTALIERHKDLMTDIIDKRENFRKQCSRLHVVRKIKQKEWIDAKELEYSNQCLDNDMYSDASTVSGMSRSMSSVHSSATGKTYRSLKNKRKLERKKYNCKEGSAFEDLGLVISLHDSITQTEDLTTTVHSINTTLLLLCEDKKAKQLQAILDEFLQDIKREKSTIWPSTPCEPTEIGSDTTEFGPGMTSEEVLKKFKNPFSHSDDVISQRMKQLDVSYQFPPQTKITDWKIKLLR